MFVIALGLGLRFGLESGLSLGFRLLLEFGLALGLGLALGFEKFWIRDKAGFRLGLGSS